MGLMGKEAASKQATMCRWCHLHWFRGSKLGIYKIRLEASLLQPGSEIRLEVSPATTGLICSPPSCQGPMVHLKPMKTTLVPKSTHLQRHDALLRPPITRFATNAQPMLAATLSHRTNLVLRGPPACGDPRLCSLPPAS